MNFPLLSLIVWSPMLAAVLVSLLPAQPLTVPRRAAFGL